MGTYLKFSSTLNTLNTFSEAKRVYFDDFLSLKELPYTPLWTNQTVEFDKFFNDFLEFKGNHENFMHRKDDKFIFGMYLRVLLDKKHNKKEMCSIAKQIIEERYKNYPTYVWYYSLGKANYLVFFICDRKYFNGEEKIINDYYKSDYYEDSITHKLCKKDNPNATLKFKKGDIRTSYKGKFSYKDSNLFYNFKNISKKKFIAWSLNFRFYLTELFKQYGAKVKDEVSFVQIGYKEAYENKKVSKKKQYEYLSKIQYINKGLNLAANEFTKIIDNLNNGNILLENDSHIKELRKIYYKFYNQVKYRKFYYVSGHHKIAFEMDFHKSWLEIKTTMQTFIENVILDLKKYLNKEILGFDYYAL